MAPSLSSTTFHQEFKAQNIQIPGSIMTAFHEPLIFRIHVKDEKCCSFWEEPLTRDWSLLLRLQISRGVEIKLRGMIFITRLTWGEVSLCKDIYTLLVALFTSCFYLLYLVHLPYYWKLSLRQNVLERDFVQEPKFYVARIANFKIFQNRNFWLFC